MRRIHTILVVSFLFFALGNPSWGFDREKEARTVTVTGNGRVETVPDIARVELGVHVEGTDVETASAAARHDMAAVLEALKSAGVPSKDIQTQAFSVYPKMAWESTNGSRIVGYIVDNQIKVTLRDLGRVGRILSAALNAGANRVTGPQFDLADRPQYERKALELAMADAKERASLLARSSGSGLGEALVIQEGERGFPIRPMFGAAMAKTSGTQEPITAGQETISASVTVTYALINP